MEPGVTPDVTVQEPQESTAVPKWVVWALLGALLVLTLAIAPVAYFAAAPLDCAGCHDDPSFLAVTQASSHADVECLGCHAGSDALSRIDFGFRQAYAMAIPVLGDTMRDGGVAYDSRCTSCHDELGGILNRDGINIAHETCSVGSACTDCHGGLAHSDTTGVWITSYTMDQCLECHAVGEVRRDCSTCHEGRREGDRALKGAWAVTHGPDWQRTHGMGNLATCSACHADSLCAGCHGAGVPHGVNFLNDHGGVAQDPGADCTSCHQTQYCSDCHSGIEMPHPAEFIAQHSAIVERDGEAACLNCHSRPDCDGCHVAHVHPGGSIGLGGDL